MGIGLAFVGFAGAGILVSTIPEILYQVKTQENDKLKKKGLAPLNKNVKSLISDKASAIGNLAIVVGNIIAPMVGGGLVDKYSFRTTSTIMSFTCFCLFLFYLVFGILLRPKDIPEPEEETKTIVT
jgi:MFS family permease